MKLESGPEDRGLRLDVFLSRRLHDLTRSELQALSRRGSILVDGRPAKSGRRLRGGERIEVDRPPPEPTDLEPAPIPFRVLYEDLHLAVIEKPAGIVVHPGAGHRSGTLVHGLLARFPDLVGAGDRRRPGIVHRLDKWTSGLMVVAKTATAHHRLTTSFEKRAVRKTYLALVHGRTKAESGTIDLRIRRHPRVRTRMTTGVEEGRTAASDYQVIGRRNGFTLLEVRIRTGRTHQIRVHLSAVGHPVVGDDVYGEKAHRAFERRWGPLNRYFLHASGLDFPHPLTGQPLQFHSDLPEELMELWERLPNSGQISSVGGRLRQ